MTVSLDVHRTGSDRNAKKIGVDRRFGHGAAEGEMMRGRDGTQMRAAGLMLIERAPRVKSCCLRDDAPVIAFRRIIEGDSPCRKVVPGKGITLRAR